LAYADRLRRVKPSETQKNKIRRIGNTNLKIVGRVKKVKKVKKRPKTSSVEPGADGPRLGDSYGGKEEG